MPEFTPVSELLHKKAIDANGEFVGWISELLIDAADGRVEYVRIEMPREDDRRRTEVVIPWSVIRRSRREDQCIRVAARKSAIELLTQI